MAQQIDGIWIDPKLSENFDNTRNEDRSEEELEQWWNNPFVVTRASDNFEVRVLDGGAWDRSTYKGNYETLEQAVAYAKGMKDGIEWQNSYRKFKKLIEEAG